MLGKKFKIRVIAIMTAIQSFNMLPAYAYNSFIPEKDSCGNILLAEALVEYPYGWFYTLNEIEKLYEDEYYENARLENFIKFENGKYINQCNNEQSEIPGLFIETTLKLLKQMLDRELMKYLFRLDAFHGHLFVTDKQFENKYLSLNTKECMKKFVYDDSLGVLFHCAEHLALRNPPQTGAIDKDAQKLIKKRNIIGWYDAGSVEIYNAQRDELVGEGKSNTATIPQGFRGVGAITFKANINGEFSIEHHGQIIRLDISLCDYYYH